MTTVRRTLIPGAIIAMAGLAIWIAFGTIRVSAHDCGTALEQASYVGGCTHGPDPAPPGENAGIPDAPAQYTEASYAICDGNGTSGDRVQVMYVHASDKPDRFNQYVNSFRIWASTGDHVYQASAEQTGGSRYIRFVQDGNCVITVLDVTVSSSGDDDFWSLTGELYDKGYHDNSRKYLVFLDRNDENYCGQADVYHDDSPGQGNTNNTTYGFAVIYNGCWDSRLTISHELGHNFGAVQGSAPHASLWDHCTDEWDVMCYDDGSGIPLTYPCSDPDDNWLLDCNKDDYFNTNPKPGSYLATHWNIANSAWLGSNSSKVALDKESSKYNGWVAATMSGFTPGKLITLYWSDQSVLGTVTATSSGQGTINYRTPLAPYGWYTVMAKDSSGKSDTEVIKVIPRINLSDFDGYPGDTTRVYLYGYAEGDQVAVEWTLNDSSVIDLAKVTIASNGRGSVVVTIPSGPEPGAHKIVGDALGQGRSGSVSYTLDQTPWTVTLDKSSSKYNGAVTATLSGFTPSKQIAITFSDGTDLGTVLANGSGGGKITFRTPLSPLGNYAVIATDTAGHIGLASLRVIPRISTNIATAMPGDQVRVYYYGFAPGDEVETRWYNTSGSSYVVLNTVAIADTGRGSALFSVPDDNQPGAHTLRGSTIGVSRSTSMTFTETAPAWTFSLSTSSSKYNGTVTATMTGFKPNGKITLTWSDGTVLGTKTANASGNATIAFRTPLAPLGDYTVTATDAAGSSATEPLRVIPRINTNVTSGEPGDVIRVYGYGYAPGDTVQVWWYLDSGNYVVMATLYIGDQGTDSVLINVPWAAVDGANTIRGVATNSSRSASMTFTVSNPGGAEDPTATPTPVVMATATPEPTSATSPTPDPELTPIEVATETPTSVPEMTPTEVPVETETPVPTSTIVPLEGSPTAAPEMSPDLTPTPYVVTNISRSTNSSVGGAAVDGDPTTVWMATDDGSSTVGAVQFDYGQAIELGTIRIQAGDGGLTGIGYVQVSDDGETWIDYGSVGSDATAANDGWIVIRPISDPVPPGSARYVRIVYLFNGATTVGNIAEFEVLPPNP